MKNKMPRTPFSTGLSKSAKETEIRIRNIFSGPKKRPPVLLIVLIALLILLCGNLVAFRTWPAAPTIVMETQYYDSYANYLEIPMLALPAGEQNDAVDAINAAMTELKAEYEFVETNLGVPSRCMLYPSTTDRYINLVFTEISGSYGSDGNIRTWVYDKKEGTQVTGEQALNLAGTTQEELFSRLEELIAGDPEDPRTLYPATPDPIAILGFRIKADGKPVFYLSAFVDYVDRGEDGFYFYDEWTRLYVWDNGKFSRYSCMFTLQDEYPLVPAEETDQLDPPLWNQWWFSGGEPAGGFVDKTLLERPSPGENPYGWNFQDVLLEQYAQYADQWNVYYSDYQTENDQAGDMRVGPAIYLGEIPRGGEEYAAAYQVCYTFYTEGPHGLEWHANHEMMVFSFDAQNRSFGDLLGRAAYSDQLAELPVEELIAQIAGK